MTLNPGSCYGSQRAASHCTDCSKRPSDDPLTGLAAGSAVLGCSEQCAAHGRRARMLLPCWVRLAQCTEAKWPPQTAAYRHIASGRFRDSWL